MHGLFELTRKTVLHFKGQNTDQRETTEPPPPLALLPAL
jgi:hypothetical protein